MATPSILRYVRHTDTPPVYGRFVDLKGLEGLPRQHRSPAIRFRARCLRSRSVGWLGGLEPNRSQTSAQTPTQNYTLRSNISMILLRSLLA